MPVEKSNAHNKEFVEYCMCEFLNRLFIFHTVVEKKIKKGATAFVNVREPVTIYSRDVFLG